MKNVIVVYGINTWHKWWENSVFVRLGISKESKLVLHHSEQRGGEALYTNMC